MEVNGLTGVNNSVNNTVNVSTPVTKPITTNKTNTNGRRATNKNKIDNVGETNTTGKPIRSHVKEYSQEDLEKQLKDIVDKINQRIVTNTEVDFSIHEGTNKVNMKIIDKTTKEVLNEWPGEKALDFLAKIIDREAVVFDKKL